MKLDLVGVQVVQNLDPVTVTDMGRWDKTLMQFEAWDFESNGIAFPLRVDASWRKTFTGRSKHAGAVRKHSVTIRFSHLGQVSQSIFALKRPSIGKPFHQTCRAPAGCGGYSSSTVGVLDLASRLPAYPSALRARGKKR